MVDVSVRENYRVEILDREGKSAVFLGGFLPFPLKHSTIEGNCLPIHVQEVARTGHFTGRADEGDFQPLAFCYRITLEQDGKSLLVLRHQRGLPASTAPLIQQVGESIFIFTRMTRQLDDHSLVFFHH